MGKKTNPTVMNLTLKTAKGLAKRELGTAKDMTVDGYTAQGRCYRMALGNLVIRFYPKQIEGRWYIAMDANWAGNSDRTIQFFDPALMKNFVAEERYWEQHRKDQFQDWVDGHGLEFCCRKVKEAWEKQK